MKRARLVRSNDASKAQPTLPSPQERGMLPGLHLQPFWRLLLVLLLAGGLLALGAFLFSLSHPFQDLPIALHSSLSADYSSDPSGSFLAPVNISLIIDVLSDQTNEARNPQKAPGSQMATLIGQMQTPVASITPMPGWFVTPSPAAPRQPTQSTQTNPVPLQTAAHEPAATLLPTETTDIQMSSTATSFSLVPSVTPRPFATATLWVQPTAAPTATRALVVPTATSGVIPSPVPATAIPTVTRTHTPTSDLSTLIPTLTRAPTSSTARTSTRTSTALPTSAQVTLTPTPTRTPSQTVTSSGGQNTATAAPTRTYTLPASATPFNTVTHTPTNLPPTATRTLPAYPPPTTQTALPSPTVWPYP